MATSKFFPLPQGGDENSQRASPESPLAGRNRWVNSRLPQHTDNQATSSANKKANKRSGKESQKKSDKESSSTRPAQYVSVNAGNTQLDVTVQQLVDALQQLDASQSHGAYNLQITQVATPPPNPQTNFSSASTAFTTVGSSSTTIVMSTPRTSAAPTGGFAPRTSPAPPQPGPARNPASNATQRHGTSRIWVSQEAQIQRAWFKLEPHLTRMYPEGRSAHSQCPYIPRSLKEFTTHLREFDNMKFNRTQHILDDKALIQAIARERNSKVYTKQLGIHEVPLPAPRDAFDGKIKEFGSCEPDKSEVADTHKIGKIYHTNPANRGAVLSQETIWCVNYDVPWREAANWPSVQEMKWEGIQRVSTEQGKYGRFLALPRVQASAEINWQTLPLTEFYPLDKVWRIPNEEDVFAPTEDIPNDLVPNLVNKDVLDSVDPVDSL